MDVLFAIDAIDDLVQASRGLGRFKRVDAAAYQEAIKTLRVAMQSEMAEPGLSGALAIAARLEAIGTGSRRVPIVGDLLLSRDEVDRVLDDLRQFVPSAIIDQRKAGR